MATKQAVKRGRGRPPGSANKKRVRPARAPVNQTGTVEIEIDKGDVARVIERGVAKAVEAAFKPSASSLIEQVRQSINILDDVGAHLEAVGVPRAEAVLIREYHNMAATRALLALSRAD